MRKAICLLIMLIATDYSYANVIINGTRILYLQEDKDVVVQLINNSDTPALIQTWIDDGDIDSTPETANVPFLLSPPIIKVNPHNGQQLRIQKLPKLLPTDRESIFFLNVLDIPPRPEHLQNVNTVQLAIKSRIKLFYRPTNLIKKQNEAIKNIILTGENKQFRISNNSPFYITIANIIQGGKKILAESLMIEPFGQKITPTKIVIKRNQEYQLIYVDDFGAYKNQTIVSQ